MICVREESSGPDRSCLNGLPLPLSTFSLCCSDVKTSGLGGLIWDNLLRRRQDRQIGMSGIFCVVLVLDDGKAYWVVVETHEREH